MSLQKSNFCAGNLRLKIEIEERLIQFQFDTETIRVWQSFQ